MDLVPNTEYNLWYSAENTLVICVTTVDVGIEM